MSTEMCVDCGYLFENVGEYTNVCPKCSPDNPYVPQLNSITLDCVQQDYDFAQLMCNEITGKVVIGVFERQELAQVVISDEDIDRLIAWLTAVKEKKDASNNPNVQ